MASFLIDESLPRAVGRAVAALDESLSYAIAGGLVIVDPARVRVLPVARS